MLLASVRTYSGRPSSTEPHLSATGAVSCRPHFASLPAPRRISAVSPHHILFCVSSLPPASTSRPLSVSSRLDVYCLAPPCFAAVDFRLSYNPGSPCFLSAPLIHPSTLLCILLFPSIILSQTRSQPCTILVPVNRLPAFRASDRQLALRAVLLRLYHLTTPNPYSATTVLSAAAYFVVSSLGFLAGMRPVCSPRLGDIRSMPYALMLSSRHSPSRASSRFIPAIPGVLDSAPSHSRAAFKTLAQCLTLIRASRSRPHPSPEPCSSLALTFITVIYLSASPSRPIPPRHRPWIIVTALCSVSRTILDRILSRFRSPLCA